MTQQLLSLKQKRELLQRMAQAVREGVALDVFCEQENIPRETLFEHLTEMRALGTKGINPFLPDVDLLLVSKPEKFRALDAMKSYADQTQADSGTICILAGITTGRWKSWERLRWFDNEKAAGRLPPLLEADNEVQAPQKRRIVAAVYKKINEGMEFERAVRLNGLTKALFI